tara:strand:- start:219 stop:389 length:171 start_codon:yes stop_codon:yes gene_type:complete
MAALFNKLNAAKTKKSKAPSQPASCAPMAGFSPGATAQRNSSGCITGWVAGLQIMI